jgi:hypothetical protein
MSSHRFLEQFPFALVCEASCVSEPNICNWQCTFSTRASFIIILPQQFDAFPIRNDHLPFITSKIPPPQVPFSCTSSLPCIYKSSTSPTISVYSVLSSIFQPLPNAMVMKKEYFSLSQACRQQPLPQSALQSTICASDILATLCGGMTCSHQMKHARRRGRTKWAWKHHLQ